jgi:hypothetical protein
MKIQDLILLIQFLTGVLLDLYRNDSARANEIKDLSIGEIIEKARNEANAAVIDADNLAKKGHEN